MGDLSVDFAMREEDMKRIKDGWLIVRAQPESTRQRYAAQPKVYYEDGTAKLLHIHAGETRQEAEAKAQAELDEFLSKNR